MKANLLLFFKSFFSSVWLLLRRLLCFRRRLRSRRDSGANEVILTSVRVDQSPSSASWSDWPSEEQVTISDKIQSYREQLQKRESLKEAAADAEPNFFADMTPTVKQQTKVYVGPEVNSDHNLKFSCQTANEEQTLAEWEEASGWEAEDPDVNSIIKEQRIKPKKLLATISPS